MKADKPDDGLIQRGGKPDILVAGHRRGKPKNSATVGLPVAFMALTIFDAQLRQVVLKQMPALRFSRLTEHFQRR